MNNPIGSWFNGIIQNIFAGLGLLMCGAVCTKVGLTKNPNLNDLSDWKAWVAIGFLFLSVLTLMIGMGIIGRWLHKHFLRRRVPKGLPHRISILVARLHDDKGGKHRERLIRTIQREMADAVHISTWPETLYENEDIATLAQNAARKTAQKWLKSKRYDVLISGYVLADRSMTVGFTVREDHNSDRVCDYALTDKLTLPEDFGDDLTAQLAARITVEAAPALNASHFVRPKLEDLRDRLRPLLDNKKEHGDLHFIYAAICAAISQQGGTLDDLQLSRMAYESALTVPSCKKFSIGWAKTQNNLGNVLVVLSQRLVGAAGLEAWDAAQNAYSAALEVFIHQDFPIDWAITQNNIGTGLQTRGARLQGRASVEMLNRALFAHNAALKVFASENRLTDWAMTQNNLGVVLKNISERVDPKASINALEDAQKAYHAALLVRTRHDFPVKWATTQINLGVALRNLGDRLDGEAGIEMLRNALKVYHAVLKVYTPQDFPNDWAATQINMGVALEAIGKRRHDAGGMEALKQSWHAYHAALKIYTRQNYSDRWAKAKENIGVLSEALFTRTGEKLYLLDGIEAIKCALDVYGSSGMDFYQTKAENTLARLQTHLSG